MPGGHYFDSSPEVASHPGEVVLALEDATVRLRTCKTKGCGSRGACETIVFKLMESAAKEWRKLTVHRRC